MDGDDIKTRAPPMRRGGLDPDRGAPGRVHVPLWRPDIATERPQPHLHAQPRGAPPPSPRAADAILAERLIDRGLVAEAELRAASSAARELGLPLGRVVLARDLLSEAALLPELAGVHDAEVLDLSRGRPDPRLIRCLPRGIALRAEAVPWRRTDRGLLVATARPDLLPRIAAACRETGPVVPVLATRAGILDAQRRLWGAAMARQAETRAPVHLSCRTWQPRRVLRVVLFAAVALLAVQILYPAQLALAAFGLAGLAFVGNMSLKTAAFATVLLGRRRGRDAGVAAAPDSAPRPLRPPVVSLLVPLYREPEIAERLVTHLARMRYPPERLDVLLLVEADDTTTAEALGRADIPPFMRVLTVPPGHPRTKPRALNYALPFAQGEIIGIYDAEDRPEPNQIAHVVRSFEEVPRDVACLQGRLDYYNSDHNLMTRLFTVEYASWFRVLLPGVARLRLVVPLGGTTLFLRRAVLEEVGAWDAHNVTEDAELGLRLARAGYRTELIETTTYEEATGAVGPWVRQRSRWLKGYIITWATAMRRPVALWRDLGTWRFLGLQAQMLTAVLGFFLAPLLWSLVVVPFGLPHPLNAVLDPHHFLWIGAFMMLSLALSIAVSVHACAAPHLRRLRPLAPLVEFYYTFGTLAAWIGAAELMGRPFFWAKTRHGIYGSLPRDGKEP